MGDLDAGATDTAPPFDPFPDTGMFATSTDVIDSSTAQAERAAAREAARQLSMTIPEDIAAVLAGALDLGAELPGGPPATQAPALLARVRGLLQLQNVLDAVLASTVRAADNAQAAEFDGHKSMKGWMAGHLRLAPATAGRVVRAVRTLEQLPRWAAAAAAGLVTADQTAVVAKAATPARLAAAADLGVDVHGEDGLDATLLACATGPAPDVLPAVVKRLLDWIDPDGPEPDPTLRRELHLTPATDGGGSIHGRLDAAGYEKVATALTAYQQAGRTKDDDRSHAAQMADALMQLADNALAAADTPMLRKHHAQIAATIAAEDLLDPDPVAGAARLGSGAAGVQHRGSAAGVRLGHQPRAVRARRDADEHRPRPETGPRTHPQSSRSPRRGVRVHRLPSTHLVVRRGLPPISRTPHSGHRPQKGFRWRPTRRSSKTR